MSVYYSEIDPRKAEWIRELIKAKVIAPGEVDERSIVDVQPDDLRGFKQCHFFAGIGVWSYSLRLARWPDDRECWTLSCPCPSFSAAGKGRGFDDPRHLWPHGIRLIRERKPATVFGEQVAAAIGHGWLDLVQTDMEAEGYAVGKAVLGACSVGAPHIRQRLYFVGAQSDSAGLQPRRIAGSAVGYGSSTDTGCGTFFGANAGCRGDESQRLELATTEGGGTSQAQEQRVRTDHRNGSETLDRGYAIGPRLEGYRQHEHNWGKPGWLDQESSRYASAAGATRGFWGDCDWWYGRDVKYRPIEPGILPLAHGVAARVLKLRGYGDAIVSEVAKAWIEICQEVL